MSAMNIDQDLSALEGARELDKKNAAEQAFSTGGRGAGAAPASGGGGGGRAEPGAAQDDGGFDFKRWMGNLPTNISVGLVDAALNTIDAIQPKNRDATAAEPPKVVAGTGGLSSEQILSTPHERRMTPSMDDEHGQVVSAIMGFRNEMANGSRTSDSITQGLSQFLVPFIGWSKGFAGIKAAASAPKLAQVGANIARVATAESATMATAFDPHAGRVADLVELGKHTEGKLADALNTMAPDGSAINAYIDYMTDRVNESEAEGRFKNVVDNLFVSAAAAGLIKIGAKTIKSAKAFSESPITLPEIGAPEHLAAQGQKLADEALAQFPDSPHAAMVQLTEQADNVLDAAERETILHARDKVAAGLPEGGYTVVPSPEGHTVVSGKQPILTFEKEEDAIAAVADAQKLLGSNFQQRAAAEHAKASDANFGTLHAFSRVLKSNVDRPVSTHSLLSALERNLKGDTEQGAFYKELLGRLVRKKVAGTTLVSSKAGRHENSAGHYAVITNGVEIYDKAFRDPKTLLHTFTHEAVHAATVHEMNASARVTSQLERVRAAAEKVFAAQVDDAPEAKTSGAKRKQYGFTDVREFVAEIEANPEFRQLMQKTKLESGETAWDEYLKTIAGILGVGALVATPAGQKEFSKLMMGPKQENDVG